MSDIADNRGMVQRAWTWLTEPHPRITRPEDRHGAQLLAILMMVNVVVVAVIVIVTGLVVHRLTGGNILQDPDTYVFVGCGVAVAIPFVMLRQGLYRSSAWVLVGINALAPLTGPFLVGPGVEIGNLAFLVVPIMLASFVMELRAVAGISIALLFLACFRLMNSGIPPRSIGTGLAILSALAVTASLLFVFRRRLGVLERIRAATLDESEKARVASEGRLRILLTNSLDILIGLDRGGFMTFIGGAFESTTGFSVAEQLGHSLYKMVHPDDREQVRDDIERAMKTTGATLRTEWRQRNHKGEVQWFEALVTNRLDHPGLDSVLVNLRDISERHRAEEERARLEEQLQQAAKAESVGRLAGGVAHGFNNLLTVIMGNAEMAMGAAEQGKPVAPLLEEVRKASLGAAGLVRHLLAFSRSEMVIPTVLDLNEHVSRMAEQALAKSLGESVRLDLRLAKGLWAVKVDPMVIERIILNLAANSRDAMPGGGTIGFRTENVETTTWLPAHGSQIEPGRYVVLTVTDTGIGMTESVKAHLFEPFFSTKPAAYGAGLGLPSVYGAVRQSGGYVSVRSEPGRGTEISVYFPRAEGGESAFGSPAMGDGSAMPRGKETILYAEDNQTLRKFTAAMLESLGYRVISAANGVEALTLAAKTRDSIDLLFTDTVMPEMDGMLLAKNLSAIHPETRALFTSGYAADVMPVGEVIDRKMEFLSKPYTPEALARKVRAVIDRKTSR